MGCKLRWRQRIAFVVGPWLLGWAAKIKGVEVDMTEVRSALRNLGRVSRG